jgi:type IV secretory pathway VirB10-like protein
MSARCSLHTDVLSRRAIIPAKRAVLPAQLQQSHLSDLELSLVSSNVFDTASGRYLLIPQGPRLIGVYNSRIGYGQDPQFK